LYLVTIFVASNNHLQLGLPELYKMTLYSANSQYRSVGGWWLSSCLVYQIPDRWLSSHHPSQLDEQRSSYRYLRHEADKSYRLPVDDRLDILVIIEREWLNSAGKSVAFAAYVMSLLFAFDEAKITELPGRADLATEFRWSSAWAIVLHDACKPHMKMNFTSCLGTEVAEWETRFECHVDPWWYIYYPEVRLVTSL